MTYLGHANPLHRISRTIWGWFAPPPAGRSLPPDFYIIAHRGAAMSAPENTIAAFAAAVTLGANAIETDVCMTQDNCFILWHDADPDDIIALARQVGGEGLPYVPHVPAAPSPWRLPVHHLTLVEFRTHFWYTRHVYGLADEDDEEHSPGVPPTDFEELLAWLRLEHRVRHVFLDLKLVPEQVGAVHTLLQRLHRYYTHDGFRTDLVFHILSPHLEVVAALCNEAQSIPLPATVKVYADFEWPGVRRFASRLRVRHVSMGCRVRTWVDFRHEVGQVIAACDKGHLDTIVVWTVNDETKLRELVRLGVNGIITDDPALLHRIVVEQRCTPAVSTSLPAKG